jgi:hypothetical protein
MKKNIISTLLISLIFSLSTGSAISQSTPSKYPLHFVDYWWQGCGDNKPVTNIAVIFKVKGDFDNISGIYIAPVGIAAVNGIKFYGGIQTQTLAWVSKNNRSVINLGRGGIFSRWSKDNTPIGVEYADGDELTHYQSAGTEGEFVGVRKGFNWQAGEHTYIYEINVLSDNNNYSWFVATVEDYETKAKVEIGKLKFEGKDFLLGKDFASFVEIYSGNKRSFPKMQVSFMPPFINNQQCTGRQVKAYYSNNSPYEYRYAKSSTDGDWIHVDISPNVN